MGFFDLKYSSVGNLTTRLTTESKLMEGIIGSTLGGYSLVASTLLVSGTYAKTVRVSDVATGPPSCESLTGHTDDVYSVAIISGDGRWVVSGSWEKAVRLWKLATGAPALEDKKWLMSAAVSGIVRQVVPSSIRVAMNGIVM